MSEMEYISCKNSAAVEWMKVFDDLIFVKYRNGETWCFDKGSQLS